MKYIHRQIEPVVNKILASFSSLALTGPRQSGKTTLLREILKDYQYITLDDPTRREQARSDPRLFFDSLSGKTIIDEIQQASELLSYAKIKIDSNRDQKGLFVFTGSQQFHMIKDLGESLAGRIALLDLLPFSVAEKKDALNLNTTEDFFIHACLTGSYPEPVVNPAVDASLWYGSYIQTYLERDIRSLYNIGNLRDFQRFMQLLAVRCGQVLKLSGFANELGISVPTIKNWLSVLEACRIIYLLHPYYNNMGKRVVKAPKIYFLDCGLACYLTRLKDRGHLLHGPMGGALFENFCVQETVKLYLNSGRRPDLYYLRTNNDLEIDLVIEPSLNKIIPVEIKLNKTPNPGMTRNMDRFRKIFSGLDILPGRLISLLEDSFPLTRETRAVNFVEYLGEISGLMG
jgi:uncharacterized protein